jgi:hypothetical protein
MSSGFIIFWKIVHNKYDLFGGDDFIYLLHFLLQGLWFTEVCNFYTLKDNDSQKGRNNTHG